MNNGTVFGGRGRRRGRGRGWGRRGGGERRMTVEKLEELLDDDNVENVTLELASEKGGFGSLVGGSSLEDDEIELILQLISRILGTIHRETLKSILKLLCNSAFFDIHVVNLLTVLRHHEISSFAENILDISEIIIERLPRYASNCFKCVQSLRTVLSGRSYPLEVRRVEQERKIREMARRRYTESEEPPDNYRDLQMFPSPGDVEWMERPYLRKNKEQGAFPNLDTYLDIHFRLLREDYVQPLREGIRKYKQQIGLQKANQVEDMWMYHDVHILCSVCNDDLDTRIKFNVSLLGRIRWQSTKRLIYGSLVCLSNDGFKTMLFATVTNRTTRDLLKGIIEVRFEKDFDTILRITPMETFVMAETPAYFEAYRHVLQRLQNIRDLPFQRYLVECDTNVRSPAYLDQLRRYNMAPLGDPKYEMHLRSVPVLKTDRWPPLQCYQLNNVQLDAVKTTVSKEVSIVQGPPGTGKTYVGLKIMEVLLANRNEWNGNSNSDVILVVCYTNHALDQFLEGIHRFHPEGIIRVGGRSSSEVLKPFNLKEIRYSKRKAKQRKRSVFENNRQCRTQMDQLKKSIDAVAYKLEASMIGILREDTLKPFIMPKHYLQLHSMRAVRNQTVPTWLEFRNPPKPSVGEVRQQRLVDEWTKAILYYVNQSHEEDEEIPDVSPLDIDFVQRVSLYKTWIMQFRGNILTEQMKIEGKAAESAGSERRTRPPILLKLKHKLLMSRNGILQDAEMKQFVPVKMFNGITNYPKYTECDDGQCIKAWLGASPFLFEEDISEALQELQDINEGISCSNEEAGIETNKRFVDDGDQRTQSRKILLLSKELNDLAMEFHKVDETTSDWQSAEEQVYNDHRKKQKRRLEGILTSAPTMRETEEKSLTDVRLLCISKKESLYRLWVGRYQLDLKTSIQQNEMEYRQLAKKLKEVLQEEDIDILAEADVIGMTTTGAAKHSTVLQAVSPRIIVVEEAAEVLEAHIVAALNPRCEHLILIGDHQQLRPNPTVYDLVKKYNLDVSLFERLVKNKLHHVTLEYQHRMRPEISILMRHIYPKLKDHHSVESFDDVKGVDKNVFFITHHEEESQISETKSKSNEHEASYIIALCKYFIQQGYDPADITILAAYTGQLTLIKKLMGTDKAFFQEVRLTSVDNFQGEESKIVLLSFVRSNEFGSVGFLSTDNRVCVALSRAKEGMYAVGNFSLLASKSPLWNKIVATLEANNSIGKCLLLRCRNHPEVTVEASRASDFDKAPRGGCTKVCGVLLKCGHRCKLQCHLDDREHEEYKCNEPCRNMFVQCGHRCLKRCFEICTCTTLVTKKVPYCGHDGTFLCPKKPEICHNVCDSVLQCGHKCERKCSDCRVNGFHGSCKKVLKKRLICGHIVSVRCSSYMPACPNQCEHELACGHLCKGKCAECNAAGHHIVCMEPVKKTLSCGHVFKVRCSKSKLLQKCTAICSKSLDCGHNCKGKCADCTTVHSQCEEVISVKLKCGRHFHNVKCKRRSIAYMCNQQCDVLLDCDHRCKGKCQNCAETAHEPCQEIVDVKLKCGHVYQMECYKSKKSYRCGRLCERLMSCGHKCLGKCWDCYQTKMHKDCDKCDMNSQSKRLQTLNTRQSSVQDTIKSMESANTRESLYSPRDTLTRYATQYGKLTGATAKATPLKSPRAEAARQISGTTPGGSKPTTHPIAHISPIYGTASDKTAQSVKPKPSNVHLSSRETSRLLAGLTLNEGKCSGVMKCNHICERSASDCDGVSHGLCTRRVAFTCTFGHTTITACFDAENRKCPKCN